MRARMLPRLKADVPTTTATDFLPRALWWLAIICLVYAVTSLATDVFIISIQGWPYFPRFYGAGSSRAWQKLELVMAVCSLAAMVGLVTGAYGLLRWRRWSRVALLSSAAGLLLTSFISRSLWLLLFLQQARATTRAYYQPPPWYFVSTTLTQWIAYSVLPIIVVWTMLQREVVNLWARRSASGFEVLPVARVLDGDSR